ncbi:MAG TPA: hypothetical protein PLQ99_02190, partial [Bacilli bacterium]|nr:hypothetical protein [Bacilli bacterium]
AFFSVYHYSIFLLCCQGFCFIFQKQAPISLKPIYIIYYLPSKVKHFLLFAMPFYSAQKKAASYPETA